MGAHPIAIDGALIVQRQNSQSAAASCRSCRRCRARRFRSHPRTTRLTRLRESRQARRSRRSRTPVRALGACAVASADGAGHCVRGRAAGRARRLLALMTDGEHIPVLQNEAVAALSISRDDVVVDATFGRGGHARAILAALGPRGRLIAIDRDPAAANAAREINDARFTFGHAWFSELPEFVAAARVNAIDAVLIDLGVSSPQLDDATRGFSYRVEGPLDMRMDTTRGESAADFLARASVRELTEVIRDYGEERFAQAIAGAIAAARAVAPIVSTKQLAAIVGKAVGAK